MKNHHRPLNPYINSGAIASLYMVSGGPEGRFQRVMELLRKLTANDALSIDEQVYVSEKQTGHRNRPSPIL